MTEFEAALQSVRDVFVNYPRRVTSNQEELRKIDDEIQDVLHMIEFGNFNASDGFKFAKDLQRLRNDRRKIKDDLELLKPIEEFIAFVKPTEKNINSTIGELRKVMNVHKTRVYKMRVRTDKQDFIKNKNAEVK
jgi:hypothetical protein